MKILIPKTEKSIYFKYYQQSEECKNKPEKLRGLLKQLNNEVGTYLSKKKPNKSIFQNNIEQLQFPNMDVLQQEQINNIEIMKRLKYQFNQQQKRLTILEQKNMRIDLVYKISQCEQNIKMLQQQIETQKKITQKQEKEITQIEEQDGQQSQQIEKSIQEYQLKNYLLIQLIENQQKKSQKHSEYQSQVRDKVILKEQQCAIILEQDFLLEQQYQKAQLKLLKYERNKQILEEKYQVDLKLLKQDIQRKSKQLMELENFIIKIHLEIIQINETCLRLKEFQMKRSSTIRQRIKQSQQYNQQSLQGQDYYQSDNKLQIVSNSFYNTKQIDNSNVQADIQKINKQQFSPILDEFNHQKQEQNIINNDIVNEDTLKLQIGTLDEEKYSYTEIQNKEIVEKQQESQKLEQQIYSEQMVLIFQHFTASPSIFFLIFLYNLCQFFQTTYLLINKVSLIK
ncbi:unnamed protein product [Paramecium pentaurelia]|uniref:Uncharacterized protein n=1 Tax=Paramecium pentaurelia TaxID=43138 RepID=A0A8S1SFP6_9CILI|nr:unnamed protein product [Paramecium pentaurelia]